MNFNFLVKDENGGIKIDYDILFAEYQCGMPERTESFSEFVERKINEVLTPQGDKK